MKLTKPLVALFSLIIVIWLIIGLGPWFFFKDQPAIAAQYGDAFGAANSLFSALALFFVIFTIWKQDDESASRDKQHKEMLQLQALSTLAQVQLTKWTEARSEVTAADPLTPFFRREREHIANKQFEKLSATTKKLEEILRQTGIDLPESPKEKE